MEVENKNEIQQHTKLPQKTQQLYIDTCQMCWRFYRVPLSAGTL